MLWADQLLENQSQVQNDLVPSADLFVKQRAALVNVVYKHAPYIVYPDPGKPWNFDRNGRHQNATARLQRRAPRN